MNKIEKSEKIGELVAALASIQSKLPTMNKGEKGYGYNYTSLAATIEDTREILGNVGIAVIQLTTNVGDKPAIITTLAHSSGQYISTLAAAPLVEMKGINEAQRAGAVYSYLRRYGLQAILNLGSEDNDASSSGFKKPESKPVGYNRPANKTYVKPAANVATKTVTKTEEEEIF